jgi:hypothetical protein
VDNEGERSMRKFALAAGVVLILMVTACSSTSSTETGGGSTAAPAALENGRHYGVLKAVAADPNTVDLNEQEYFSGTAADKAAIEDGVLKEGESMPDDTYIRDTSKAVVTLAVVDSPEVGVLKFDGGSPDTQPVTYAEFVKLFNSPNDKGALRQHGYWLTVDGGEVTIIEEQFHP